jgi:hypothetical protein
MTGGRAFLYDPDGRHVAALDARSVHATRLSAAIAARADGDTLATAFRGLVEGQAGAGSALAERLLADDAIAGDVWLVEPIAMQPPVHAPDGAATSTVLEKVPVGR